MRFPADFVWGAASASYQIEGGAAADGKGPSIWDTFSHTPGKVYHGHTGDTACNTYADPDTDLDLMVQLGISNYRFSISWPRVMPTGRRPVNEAGLAYYDRLVDGCLRRGITPWITLFHWDLPQALEDEGGWLSRSTADAFGDYAALIASHFKGRVKRFFTLNEPQCSIVLGYGVGEHAPGKKLGMSAVFQGYLTQMLAHGKAVKAIRDIIPDAEIGLATCGNVCYPVTESAQDIEAARTLTFSPLDDGMFSQLFNHHWFLDPLVLGRFPDTGSPELLAAAAAVPQSDLDTICQPLDFLALNIYQGAPALMTETGPALAPEKVNTTLTAIKWPITPEVLRWAPQFIHERYGLPIYISENGLSCNDKVYLDGSVHDLDRIDFLTRYLTQLKSAVDSGVPVKGYFHWSLTDNFEWAYGYSERFGLIYVDYDTQQRIVKDSARWYSELIRSQK